MTKATAASTTAMRAVTLAAVVLAYLLPKPTLSSVVLLIFLSLMISTGRPLHLKETKLCLAVMATLIPTALGWPSVTPVLGAVLLGYLATRINSSKLWRPHFPRHAIALSVLTLGAVASFAIFLEPLPEAPTGTLTWSQSARPIDNTVLLVLGLVLASVVNGIFEETLWRVILPKLHPPDISVIVWQLLVCVGFGLVHFYGTPSGWLGVVATFLFAIIMTLLRHFSRGSIFLCVVVHVLADVILLWRLYV